MKFTLFNDNNVLNDPQSFGGFIPNNNKKSLAQFCSECFQVFSTDVQIRFFGNHSCIKEVVGSPLTVTNNLFHEHCCFVVDSLNLPERKLVSFLTKSRRPDVVDKKQLILLLHGNTGCGRSKTFKAATMMFFDIFDSQTFCILCPTKITASLANGVTVLSFVGLKNWSDAELEDGRVHAKSGLTSSRLVSIRLVRTIFLEDFGVMSKHQFGFLNAFLKAVHNNDEFFGGVDVIFSEHYLKCDLLLDSSLYASSDCLLFKLDSLDGKGNMFKSVLEHMMDNNVTSEMVDWMNIEWGENIVANKRVSIFIMCYIIYQVLLCLL
jgi:hypothetical protein